MFNRHAMCRPVFLIAGMVTVFAMGIATTYLYEGAMRPLRPVSFSEALFASDEDKRSFARLSEVMTIVEEQYHSEVSGNKLFDLLVSGINGLDPHSQVVLPSSIDESHNHKGVLGIEISRSSDPLVRGIVVVSPIEGSPADLAGIRPKDLITKILVPGKRGLKDEWRSTESMSPKDAASLLSGPPGSEVEFKVVRIGEIEPLSFKIRREISRPVSVRHELKEDGIGYVKITVFDDKIAWKTMFDNKLKAWAVINAVESMKAKNGRALSGLVLDLRGNPGGLVDAVVAVTDLFLEKSRYSSFEGATTLSQEHRGGREVIARVSGVKDVIDGAPLLILIDGGSASASEIAAGVLQKHGRATIAGTRSFGKGTVQMHLGLRNSGMLILTISQYLVGPVGCEQAVQNVGIKPDILLGDSQSSSTPEVREADLPGTIGTSVVSTDKCKHRYTLPDGHKEAAYKMLQVMHLEPAVE